MLNKKILRQVLLFKEDTPVYSKVKDLCEIALKYQSENEIYFLKSRRREKSIIIDLKLFFEFLSDTQNIKANSFNDVNKILNASTRSENIEYSGNSKNNIVRIFDNVVVVKKIGEVTKLYQVDDLYIFEVIDDFVAIENGETFLKIEKYANFFNSDYFVYISGYANSLTRTFLKEKRVEFFVDYDIEGLNIFESFECKDKKFHIPSNLENYFSNEKYNNVELYKEQRARLKASYSKFVMPVEALIKKYNTVVEQEIIYETS